MAKTDSRTIKSAHRVLEILEYFDQAHPTATVMDMSRNLSYPQSSTSELLRCLTRLGYLHYNRFRRTYSPTARVALLGAWVKPSLFRHGTLLNAVDALAEQSRETVVVSSASNYVVHHLHAVLGESEHAIPVHAGDEARLLHSAQGKLLLSSYTNDQVRSVVHRMNAEEADVSLQVKLADFIEELDVLRSLPLAIDRSRNGITTISTLLPRLRGVDRMTVSVVGATDQIDHQLQMLEMAVMDIRQRIGTECYEQPLEDRRDNVVPIRDDFKILSYRRHYA